MTFARSEFEHWAALVRVWYQLASILGEDRQHGDEIDRLTYTFKQLVDRIQTQIENLKQADSLRRELVANVSHDLRTPLATLQG
jgi:signal transduction histidine kinase